LVRVCLVEAFLISTIGGLIGAVAGAGAASLFRTFQPVGLGGFSMRLDFSPDWRVVLYAMALILVTTLLVGLIPALRSARANPSTDLHQARTIAGAPRTQRARHALVAAQLAASVAFLMVAGLFMQNLRHLQSLDLGFARDRMLLVDVDPVASGYTHNHIVLLYEIMDEKLRAIPGVQSVGQALLKPFGATMLNVDVVAEEMERTTAPSEQATAEANFVNSRYFETMQIPLVRGRKFLATDADEENRLAIVSETFAARLWPGEQPIGKRFRTPLVSDHAVEVIGVVQATKHRDGFQPM
jgi:hypothetical protein